MTTTRPAYAVECDPKRVQAAITALNAEWRSRPKVPIACTDFTGHAEAALWTADWYERLLEQQRLLGKWARFTGQPGAVRQGICQAKRVALQKSLGARARAAQWQARAAAAAICSDRAAA